MLKIRNFLDKSKASISADTESENAQIRAHIKDLSSLLSKMMEDDNFQSKTNLNSKDAEPMDLNSFEQTKKNNYKLLSVLNEDFINLQNKYHSLLGNEYPNELDDKIKKTQFEIRSVKKIIHDSNISNYKNSKNLVFLEGNEFYFQNNMNQTQRDLDVLIKKNKELKEKLLISNAKLESINVKHEVVSQNLEKHEKVAKKFGICLDWSLLAQSQLLVEKIKIENKNIDILRKRENLLRKSYDSVIEEMTQNMKFSAKMTENKQRLIDMQRRLIEESKYADFLFNQFTKNQYAQVLNDLPQPSKSKSVVDMRKDDNEKKKKKENLTESRKKVNNLEEKLLGTKRKFVSVEERVDGDMDWNDYRKKSIDFAEVVDEMELADNNKKMFKFAKEVEEKELAKDNNRRIQYKPNFKQIRERDKNASFEKREKKDFDEVIGGNNNKKPGGVPLKSNQIREGDRNIYFESKEKRNYDELFEGNNNKKIDVVPLKPNFGVRRNNHQSAPKISNYDASNVNEANCNEKNSNDLSYYSPKNGVINKLEFKTEKVEASNLKNNIKIDQDRTNNYSFNKLNSNTNNENSKHNPSQFEIIGQKGKNSNLSLNFEGVNQNIKPKPLQKEIPKPISKYELEAESPQKQLNLNFFDNSSASISQNQSSNDKKTALTTKINESHFKALTKPTNKIINDPKPTKYEEKTTNNLNLNFLPKEKNDKGGNLFQPKDNVNILKIPEIDSIQTKLEKEGKPPFQKKIMHKSAEPKNLEDFKISAKKEEEKKNFDSFGNLNQNQLKIQDSLQESKPFQMKKELKLKNEFLGDQVNNEVKKQSTRRFDEPKPFSIKKEKNVFEKEKDDFALEGNSLAKEKEKDVIDNDFNEQISASKENVEIVKNEDGDVFEPSKGFSRKTGKKIIRHEEELDKVDDYQVEINLNSYKEKLKNNDIKLQKNNEENKEESLKNESDFNQVNNANQDKPSRSIVKQENKDFTIKKESSIDNKNAKEEVGENFEISTQKKKKFDFNKRFNLNSSAEKDSNINANKIIENQIIKDSPDNNNAKSFNFNRPKKQNEIFNKPQQEPDTSKKKIILQKPFDDHSLNFDIKEKETPKIIRNNNNNAIKKEEATNVNPKIKEEKIDVKNNLVDHKKLIQTDPKNESLPTQKKNDIFSDDMAKIIFDDIIELKPSEQPKISEKQLNSHTEEANRKELFNFSEDKKMLGFFSNVKKSDSSNITQGQSKNTNKPSLNQITPSNPQAANIKISSNEEGSKLTYKKKGIVNSDLDEIILPESNKMIEPETKEREATKNKAGSKIIKKNDVNIIDDFVLEEPAEKSKKVIKKKNIKTKKKDEPEQIQVLKKEESLDIINEKKPNYYGMFANEAEKKNNANIILLDDGMEEIKPLKIKQKTRKNETKEEDLRIEQTNFFDDWS